MPPMFLPFLRPPLEVVQHGGEAIEADWRDRLAMSALRRGNAPFTSTCPCIPTEPVALGLRGEAPPMTTGGKGDAHPE